MHLHLDLGECKVTRESGAEGKPEVDERVKPGGIITVDENLHTEAVLKDGGKAEYGS